MGQLPHYTPQQQGNPQPGILPHWNTPQQPQQRGNPQPGFIPAQPSTGMGQYQQQGKPQPGILPSFNPHQQQGKPQPGPVPFTPYVSAENSTEQKVNKDIKSQAARDAYQSTQNKSFMPIGTIGQSPLPEPAAPIAYTYASLSQKEMPQETKSTVVKYSNLSTQEVAIQLINKGDTVGVLNFANDKYIGGGAFRGNNGQEESLIRTTTLFGSLSKLVNSNVDLANEVKKDYTNITYKPDITQILKEKNGVLISKDISIFRSFNRRMGQYVNLDKPYKIAVVTSAAPNLKYGKPGNYETIISEKIYSQLAAFVNAGVDSIVLGAWGCGAFQNQPTDIARVYKNLLETTFKGQFKTVVFAIPDNGLKNMFEQNGLPAQP